MNQMCRAERLSRGCVDPRDSIITRSVHQSAAGWKWYLWEIVFLFFHAAKKCWGQLGKVKCDINWLLHWFFLFYRNIPFTSIILRHSFPKNIKYVSNPTLLCKNLKGGFSIRFIRTSISTAIGWIHLSKTIFFSRCPWNFNFKLSIHIDTEWA